MEPRAFIILVGRAEGSDIVADYIINHRYHGPEIMAKELATKKR